MLLAPVEASKGQYGLLKKHDSVARVEICRYMSIYIGPQKMPIFGAEKVASAASKVDKTLLYRNKPHLKLIVWSRPS